MVEISKEKREKLRKEHRLKKTIREAAEDAGVCQSTVKKYWKIDGLKSHHRNRGAYISEDILTDEVFHDYSEELSFREIKGRIGENVGYIPLDEVVERAINSMEEQGIYERIPTCEDERYKLTIPV